MWNMSYGSNSIEGFGFPIVSTIMVMVLNINLQFNVQ